MNYRLTESTFAPLAIVSLDRNEKIQLETGAMVYQTGGVTLSGRMNANGKKGVSGALSALGRSMTSGESFFISEAISDTDGAEIALAPETLGKIVPLRIGADQWRLNTGAFLACDASVSYQMKSQKLSKAILGGTGGLFVMETRGQGDMLVSAMGDLLKITITADRPLTIDNEHVIAWSDGLDYSIKVASGTFGFKTGEGLVNEFHGEGTVYIQTRNATIFQTTE